MAPKWGQRATTDVGQGSHWAPGQGGLALGMCGMGCGGSGSTCSGGRPPAPGGAPHLPHRGNLALPGVGMSVNTWGVWGVGAPGVWAHTSCLQQGVGVCNNGGGGVCGLCVGTPVQSTHWALGWGMGGGGGARQWTNRVMCVNGTTKGEGVHNGVLPGLATTTWGWGSPTSWAPHPAPINQVCGAGVGVRCSSVGTGSWGSCVVWEGVVVAGR